MTDQLAGQVGVITGASRGIGAAVAEVLCQQGMAIVIVSRSQSALDRVAAKITAKAPDADIVPIACDVARPEEVQTLLAAVRERFEAVDLVINNAAATDPEPAMLWESDPQAWWRVMTVNVLGPVQLVRAFAPSMVQAGRGRIINVTSMLGFMDAAARSAYSTSKAALTRFTQSLAFELRGTGVLAFNYSPGHVKTELSLSMSDGPGGDLTEWAPMDLAVRGLVEIARGRFDAMEGRLVHARDLESGVCDRIGEITAGVGRRLVLAPAFEGDLLASLASPKVPDPQSP